MSKLKIGWIAFLFILFAAFWVWYGGNGTPISQAEGEALIERLEARYDVSLAEAPPGSFIRNLADMIPHDDGREFYAVNLETRKDGEEALASEQRYSEIVLPLLLRRAGHPVFVSERAGLMLGEYGDEIDRVAVVRYRSLRDMIEMALDPAMIEGRDYKYGALEHTEVFITRPTISFVQIRLLLGLILLIIGFAGVKIIGRIAATDNGHRP